MSGEGASIGLRNARSKRAESRVVVQSLKWTLHSPSSWEIVNLLRVSLQSPTEEQLGEIRGPKCSKSFVTLL